MADPLTEEVWAPIPRREGQYEVSSFGRIRSLTYRNRAANIPRIKILKLGRTTRGYAQACIGGTPQLRVCPHRLVLEVFTGPCPHAHEAGHLDGDQRNNRLDNLAWVTKEENEHHKHAHGTAHSKLTAADVLAIRQLQATVSVSGLAARFNVTPTCVLAVITRKSWRHLP